VKPKITVKEFWDAHNLALFNSDTVAEVLGCSEHKLKTDRALGKGIKFKRVGRRAMYRKEDVLKYIEEGEK
jgi:hypothetical protein